MQDTATLEPTNSDVEPESNSDNKNEFFEFKLPGVWAKLYERTSNEGNPACYGKFRRYKKTEAGYEDQIFVNSLTDIDNAIEVLVHMKTAMREFYKKRKVQED